MLPKSKHIQGCFFLLRQAIVKIYRAPTSNQLYRCNCRVIFHLYMYFFNIEIINIGTQQICFIPISKNILKKQRWMHSLSVLCQTLFLEKMMQRIREAV